MIHDCIALGGMAVGVTIGITGRARLRFCFWLILASMAYNLFG